ncbi:MAG TPA: hypothetical protein VL100_06575 [Croceibacterium sp.]|nr:hypothetical protein [Croceibacterium sp.]
MSPPPMTLEQCAFLADELDRNGCLPNGRPVLSDDPEEQFCALLIEAHAALLRQAALFFPATAEPVPAHAGPARIAFAVPKIPGSTDVSAEIFRSLAGLCIKTALHDVPAETWIGELKKIADLPEPLLAASHMPRAACELDIPVLEWHSVFLQLGYGRRAIVVNHSLTSAAPSIGVHFARQKDKANHLLARAGFPVAEGSVVTDLQGALRCAEAIGYPVVIKPADRDGGEAVSADIRTPRELRQAFDRARAASPRVMVEKHIPGLDYRLLFLREELLMVVERRPGGVEGNGRDTIARLLEQLNAKQARDDAFTAELEFDDEARLMLERENLSLASIPADGAFVRLRRAANHALGGTVRRVEEIHPDNVDLARRAMRLLRLDIAGMDLILPDVTRSWRETGGAICEVNAQPTLGDPTRRDLYKEILQQMMPHGGRIPVVLAVGVLDDAITGGLAGQMPGLAVVDANGARRGGKPQSLPGASWAHACQAPLYDLDTEAALFVLDPGQPIALASPADRYSASFVLEPLEEIAPSLVHLLRRAARVWTVAATGPALERAGLGFEILSEKNIARALAAALRGEATTSAARKVPDPRETAPRARRKRR